MNASTETVEKVAAPARSATRLAAKAHRRHGCWSACGSLLGLGLVFYLFHAWNPELVRQIRAELSFRAAA